MKTEPTEDALRIKFEGRHVTVRKARMCYTCGKWLEPGDDAINIPCKSAVDGRMVTVTICIVCGHLMMRATGKYAEQLTRGQFNGPRMPNCLRKELKKFMADPRGCILETVRMCEERQKNDDVVRETKPRTLVLKADQYDCNLIVMHDNKRHRMAEFHPGDKVIVQRGVNGRKHLSTVKDVTECSAHGTSKSKRGKYFYLHFEADDFYYAGFNRRMKDARGERKENNHDKM